MRYFVDKILYKIQKYHWFWQFGFGKKMLKMKNVYAVQFARSKAFRTNGYSSSGGADILEDCICLTRQLAEEVFENCTEKWRPADKKRGYIHDDELVLWEYNDGYSKQLKNYEQTYL